MHGIASERRTVDQATWIRLAGRIVFNDFTFKNRADDFPKCESISYYFLIGVIRDPNPISLNRLPNRSDIHSGLLN
jgi:hypothetical protein